jgi:MFS family permease
VPLAATSLTAMLLSALLFGGAMFTVPTAITDVLKVSLAKPAWGPAMAWFTAAFAVGQAIGPTLTGFIADRTGSLQAALAASVAILVAAAAASMLQGTLPRTLAVPPSVRTAA